MSLQLTERFTVGKKILKSLFFQETKERERYEKNQLIFFSILDIVNQIMNYLFS